PKRRKTKPRVVLPGTSSFEVSSRTSFPITHSVAPEVHSTESTLVFCPPITPVSAPRAFTRLTDVNTLANVTIARPDVPVPSSFEDPREPFDDRSPSPDLPAINSVISHRIERPRTAPPGENIFTAKARTTEYEKIDSVIQNLRSMQISPFQLMQQVLDSDNWQYDYHRTHLYRADSSRLSQLVDAIMENEQGKLKLLECMRPHLIDSACSIVAEQMEERHKSSIMSGIQQITPEFIDAWNIEDDIDHTPLLTRILETAAQSPEAKAKNKIKQPEKMCRVLTRQLLYHYSNRCLGFQGIFGL
ncbi:hypothetical protein R3P38DRAFT_2377389, partial [Favolaschia claudopus]